MNTVSKIAMITASIIGVTTLTACQTTTAPQDAKKHDQRRISPEQREAFKAHQQRHRDMMQQIKTACDGKTSGQQVQIKTAEKTVDGTCIMRFKADREEMRKMRGEHRPMQGRINGEFRGPSMRMTGEPMTDAQRAEMTKNFDQRLAQRQAREQAIFKACQGQKSGQNVELKIATQTVKGQCQVRFQPKPPVATTPAPAVQKAA